MNRSQPIANMANPSPGAQDPRPQTQGLRLLQLRLVSWPGSGKTQLPSLWPRTTAEGTTATLNIVLTQNLTVLRPLSL